jgi:hypothetical protein
MVRPLRVYLDQLHLGPQADAAVACMVELAERGELRVPISLTHFLETSKDKPSRRDLVRERLVSLSAGEVLAGELAVLRLEAEAARHARPHDWVRERVVSANVWDWVVAPISPLWLRAARRALPIAPPRLFRWMAAIPDDRRLGVVAGQALARGADDANALRGRLPEGAEALRGLELDDLVVGLDERALGTRFRAMGARRALQEEILRARAAGLEPNDLTDLAFLSVALPYLDAVCVDRRMNARIEAARKTASVPWARAFRKIDDLLAWLATPPPDGQHDV